VRVLPRRRGSHRRRPPACAADVDGTFDHASFACTNREEFERRLAKRDIEYRVARVPLTGQVQLFFRDPAGNGVELSFASDELEGVP
jgi:hypothetical protein